MRKKNTEIRLVNGGVNADDSVQLLKENELVNALNVTISNPYQQVQNSNSSLPAPELYTPVQDILNLDAGNYTLLGHCTDVSEKKLYLFFYNSLGFHKIISVYDGIAVLHFADNYLVGGLGWTPDMFISARVFGDLLLFTDGSNSQRYINTTKTYTVGSVTQEMITLGQEPYASPLKVARVTDSTITTNTVQLNGFQFTYRTQNDEGFTSVLSPYSETVPPVRQSDMSVTSNFGNTVECQLSFEVTIPDDWKRVDFVVRYLSDNTFFIYRSFFASNPADAAAVALHNAGTTPLTATFTGVAIEAIDTVSANKQFESIPRTSKYLEVALNRLSVANNLEGYDTPTIFPTNISITENTINGTLPSGTKTTVYLVLAKNFAINDADFPIYGALICELYREGKWRVYSLPYEYSRLRFNGYTTLYLDTRTSFPYLPPQIISLDSLIEIPTAFDGAGIPTVPSVAGYFDFLDLISATTPSKNGFNLDSGGYCYNQVLAQLVWFVHGIGDLVGTGGVVSSGDWKAVTTPTTAGYIGYSHFKMWGGGGGYNYSIYVTDAPTEFVGTDNHAFLPSSNYSYGIRYYDELLRTCGNLFESKLNIPDYNPYTNELLGSIDVSLSGTTGGAPDWAKYFSFTMSKNDSCQDFIQFMPNCIKVARQKDDGTIYVTSDWSNNFLNDKLYAVAVPLDSLGQYHKGYSYDPSTSIYDRVNLTFAFGFPSAYTSVEQFTGNVLGVLDGHVLIAPPALDINDWITIALSSQYKQIASPTWDGTLGYVHSNFVEYDGQYRQRQRICFATILIGNQPDINCYEVGYMGACEDLGSGNQPSYFYLGTGTATTVTINGDCYTQKRESRIGGFTGLSTTTNENQQTLTWFDNTGRIAPIDRIGERYLPNAIRWSNTSILGAFDNNLSKFDALDYKLTDSRAGEINMLWSQLGDTERSNAMLIICKSNGYYAMLGQNVLYNSNGDSNITVSNNYIDNIQELNGRAGTQSPRSFASYDGMVFWVDSVQKCVQMYKSGNTVAVSNFKTIRVFEKIMQEVTDRVLQGLITGGINPLTGEYLVSFPSATEISKPNLPTTNIEFPFDFYYDKNYTWVFNYNNNKWTNIITTGRWYMNVAKDVYSWQRVTSSMFSAFYKEYTLNTNSPENDAMICVPFNLEYPKVKSPLAISLDASRAPDETWVFAYTNGNVDSSIEDTYSVMVANVGDWVYREGQWQCSILRNRLSNNAANATQYNQSGINGFRLKGKVIQIAMIWYAAQGKFNVTSVQLNYT